MRDSTIKFIYAIKGEIEFRPTLQETAIAFMADYTGTPESYYNKENLYDIVKGFFLDFLGSTDDPVFTVSQYFHAKHLGLETRDDTYAMLVAMQLAQVRNEHGYVNGFRDVK